MSWDGYTRQLTSGPVVVRTTCTSGPPEVEDSKEEVRTVNTSGPPHNNNCVICNYRKNNKPPS